MVGRTGAFCVSREEHQVDPHGYRGTPIQKNEGHRKAKIAFAFAALFVVGLIVSAALGAAGPLTVPTTDATSTATDAPPSDATGASSSASLCGSTDTAHIAAGFVDGNLTVTGSGFPSLCDVSLNTLGPAGTADSGTTSAGVDGSFTYSAPLDGAAGTYQVDATDMNGATLASASFELGVAGAVTSLIVKLRADLSSDEQDAVIARDGGTETKTIAPLRLHVVQVAADEADATLQRYQGDTPDVVRAELDKTREARGEPSDPGYADQWALPKIGWDNVYGIVDVTGSAKIAVLDTGVSSADGDVNVGSGWSAFGTDPASDPNGHGTWVSSIAAAASNDKGIAGVDFANTTIQPVQVLDSGGVGQDSDIIEGVIWAAGNGADVVLMSFSNPGFSPALQDAIDYAWAQGAVIVAATGNDGSATPTFPAGDAGVIGVSATDQDDAL
ncbi:MAG TPA: S8 family serine peptidase, partial [Candidatus Limnocylindrales bacterium]|nr:S8 family serine peptidase [Candidatus Limnocylindrales bacterium]